MRDAGWEILAGCGMACLFMTGCGMKGFSVAGCGMGNYCGMRDESISNIETLQNASCVQKSKPWFHICNLHPVGCRTIYNISMAEGPLNSCLFFRFSMARFFGGLAG